MDFSSFTAPSQGHWSCSNAFLLSYQLCGDLSCSFGCVRGLLLVFNDNLTTCRCLFDVFVWVDEFHVLLLYHLTLPQVYVFDDLKNIFMVYLVFLTVLGSELIIFVFFENYSNHAYFQSY